MRTRLFWTGPFGCGGAIGTGTATTFCGGVAAFGPNGPPGAGGRGSPGELSGGAPPFCGACCWGGGGCWPNDVDPTSARMQIRMGTPFMPESLEDQTKWLKSNRSNSGALEQRLQNLFGLKNFARDPSGRARVFFVIGANHFRG